MDKFEQIKKAGTLVLLVIILGVFSYFGPKREAANNDLESRVLPKAGVVLPVVWGDLGKQLVAAGVIDKQKFAALYAGRGGLSPEIKTLLEGNASRKLKITTENSGELLNLFWALGLGNKNDILDKGEMMDPRFGGAGNFASTGGWSLAQGEAMQHYSQHPFISLNQAQQELVDRVSRNIYRPCCGNSTHFPDCNHGMAMLGFLELMAAQGVSEQDMYKYALAVNSYAKFLKTKGFAWQNVNPQSILGSQFSSATGYRQIMDQMAPLQERGGGSCGI